jgi:predicted nucleic acid-binding protein
MTDPPAKAPPSLTSFGPGEAAAIPLAGSLAAVLLINERRASEYARRDGTQVITVPAFIVALRGQEIIGDRAARRKLTLIAPITAPDFIAEAFELLDQIP